MPPSRRPCPALFSSSAVVVLLIAAAASAPATATASGGAARQPNILIFHPDDLAHFWDDAPAVPPGGNAVVRYDTPHLDKVRAEGAVFTRAYTASPMCAPSRYSLLTGRYASRGGAARRLTAGCGAALTVTDVTVPKCKLDDEPRANLQTALRAANYTTGVVGKWHLSAEVRGDGAWLPTATAYPARTQAAKDAGFDFADGFYTGNMDSACRAGLCKDTVGFSHNMEWVTASAIGFVEGAVAGGRPFFLYFNPTVPHSPDAEEALTVLTLRDTPAGALAADPASGMPSRASVLARATAQAAGGNANAIAKALGDAISATWIDDAMGALVAALDRLGVLDDTLLVFAHDHGAGGKGTLYERGGRIALFARYPNHDGGFFAAGASYGQLVSNLDLAPTALELATGAAPADGDAAALDGRSLLSLASAPPDDGRALFLELNKDRAVVTRDAKLIVRLVEGYDAGGSKKTCQQPGAAPQASPYPAREAAVQLFDLAADGAEQANLADEPSSAALQAGLEALLDCHVARTAIGAPADFAACGVGSGGSSGSTAAPTTRAPSAAVSDDDEASTPAPSTAPTTTAAPTVSCDPSTGPKRGNCPVAGCAAPPAGCTEATFFERNGSSDCCPRMCHFVDGDGNGCGTESSGGGSVLLAGGSRLSLLFAVLGVVMMLM